MFVSTLRDPHLWPTDVNEGSEGGVSGPIGTPNSVLQDSWSDMYFTVFIGMVSQVHNVDPEASLDTQN
jgi:hypothetical protein